MNVLDLATQKVKLKRASSTGGGEWQGPCPACGGEDRFHVWPKQNDGKGGYWCRVCAKAGDNIQFLRDFDGLTFREACSRLNINIPDRPSHDKNLTQKNMPPEKPPFQPAAHPAPADLWQERAERLVSWAQESLSKNTDMLSWLAGRGIGAETAKEFRLGWNHGENGKDIYRPRKSWGLEEVLKEDGKPKMLWIPRGLVIPYMIDGVIQRIRIRRPDGEPRYYVIPGSSMATMLIGVERKAFVVVESELDAIACAASQDIAGAVAVGSVSAKPDAAACAILRDAVQILNALDYDAAGAKAMAWWKEQFPRCDRWPVPQGKDPGDALKMGTDLEKWIKTGLPPVLTIEEDSKSKGQGARLKDQENPPFVKGDTGGLQDDVLSRPDLPPDIWELLTLLRKNPGVVIYNTESRFAVLRHGKYVGGRINELVFRNTAITDYIMAHPDREITAENLIHPMKEGNII